ncbi:hypothetical protein MTR67_016691 [Solanum verrucosum]|uniref:Uncharacterized protein n=1 Tax=Solanum verrucosum TaxID=315347 RepID=A0AAF0QMF0_SOLVR|nr:hypothetical protein MTR67_016691 [Solanum verrucosum]
MYTNTQDCKSTAPAMAATGASTVEWPTRSPLDSTVQTGNANGGDWQEKVYEKIKSMKEMYVSKLYRLYQKIAYELQLDSLHQRRTNEQIEKLKLYKIALERILCFLGISKHDIQLAHKEKLLSVEKLINFFFSPSQQRKPTSSPVQERLPQSSMLLQQPQSLDGQTNPSMQPVHGPWKNCRGFPIGGLGFKMFMYAFSIGLVEQGLFSEGLPLLCALFDSTIPTGNANGVDWHLAGRGLPEGMFATLNKHYIQLAHKEKLLSVEKHINFFLSPCQPPKPTSSPVQEQLPQSYMQLQLPQSLDG